MHRTNRVLRKTVWIPILGLALAHWTSSGAKSAQEQAPPPRGEEASTPRKKVVVVAIGASQRLQMVGNKVITQVLNPRENIAAIQPVQNDPTSVLITGRESGSTRVTLTAADNTLEVYEVVVQFDVEFLKTLLQRAVPSANLQLLPAGNGAIIIGGNVGRAEDIDIILRTAQSVVARPENIINAMRVGGVMQVQLDCVVAFVSRSELRRMSFDFYNVGAHHQFASTVGGAINVPVGSIGGIGSAAPTISNTIGNPNGAPANLFLALFNQEQQFFGFLQALRNESLAKILAEPKLMTLSGRSATLLSGGEQAVPEAQGLGTVTVAFIPFGTKLSFLPIVMGNGKILLEVEPEVSDLDPSVGTTIAGTTVAGRRTQRVHTVVEMEDGQTLALGGLIRHSSTGGTAKVPILGDLPFIGAAFSSKNFNDIEEELVIVVTPHLVDPQSCDQVNNVLPGQETRSPDDFELFLEGILEAPRGSREVFPGGHYVPAYKNGPSNGLYPCAGDGHGGCAACGTGCTTCGGSGLAGSAVIGYSGGTSVNNGKSGTKAYTSSASSHGADLLPPVDSNEAGVQKALAGDTTGKGSKPGILPSVFGPESYDGHK